ncbi:unnamed protein product, partial [Urochloa humidicola]
LIPHLTPQARRPPLASVSFFLLPSRAAPPERAGRRPRSPPAQLRPAPPLPAVADKAGAPVPRRRSASRRLVSQVHPLPAAEIRIGSQGGGRGRTPLLTAEDWMNVAIPLLSAGSLANAAGLMLLLFQGSCILHQ